MYHHSSSSCYGSNNCPLVPPQRPDAAAFLSSLPSASMSSYGDHPQHYYSQSQAMQRYSTTGGDLAEAAAPAAVGRYSAEERRERIEKYRTKRNQRNFQKKITYACRKTLADSRPRVKGRFARNDDAADPHDPEPAFTTTTTTTEVMNDLANDDVNASSSTPEWWPAMHGALAMEDEDLLAAYLDVSASINLY